MKMSPQAKKFAGFVLVLSLCFAGQLARLLRYAMHNEFFSYVPLIPFISIYLAWVARDRLPPAAKDGWKWSVWPALVACAFLGGGLWALHAGWQPEKEDYLSVTITAYALFIMAGCMACFGRAVSRAVWFPLAFLIFMIPMPAIMLDSLEAFFQQTSAWTAQAMLAVCGMNVAREDLRLDMPGISLLVAPECSGIHSTMVLFMTAVLAGHLFLRSRWRCVLLAVVVIPLAIARNGFRIFVLGELAVHVSHRVMDSPLHHRGGPIFFALSLVPFFILLYYLRKSEVRGSCSVENAIKV